MEIDNLETNASSSDVHIEVDHRTPSVPMVSPCLKDAQNYGHSGILNMFLAKSTRDCEYIEANLPVTLELLIALYHIEGLAEKDQRPSLTNRRFKYVTLDRLKSFKDIKKLIKRYVTGITLKRVVNVFMLGNMGAGKTSLVWALQAKGTCTEKPSQTQVEQKYSVMVNSNSYMHHEIMMSIYDTPGNSKGPFKSFSNHPAIYVIVVDGILYEKDNFYATVGIYIDFIISSRKDGYIIVALNKRDESCKIGADALKLDVEEYIDLKQEETSVKFKGVYEVSTKYNSMIEVFSEDIVQLVDNFEREYGEEVHRYYPSNLSSICVPATEKEQLMILLKVSIIYDIFGDRVKNNINDIELMKTIWNSL